jgi:hypothetical protein
VGWNRVTLSRRERVWPTRKTIARLDGGAVASIAAIGTLLREQHSTADELCGGVAWGQYLDEGHYSPYQWGRYATTCAVIALAMIHGRDQVPPPDASVFESEPLHRLASVLPEEWPPTHLPPEQEKIARLKPDDFSTIMKLAYMVDALRPDQAIVPHVDRPPLLSMLLDEKLSGTNGWSTRPAPFPHRSRARHIPTTYILWALRRFPTAQRDPDVQAAYFWIADEVKKGAPEMGIDLLALAGLALHRSTDVICGNDRVKEALSACERQVSDWAREQKRLVIERPYFNGFSEGKSTDYMFLTPELMSALFLLDRGNPPLTRRFVLQVVAHLNANVVPPGVYPATGYRVQGGMVRTADQMWAVALLQRFQAVKAADERTVLPPRTGWFNTRRAAFALGIVVLLVVALIRFQEDGWSHETLFVVLGACLLLAAEVLIGWAVSRK